MRVALVTSNIVVNVIDSLTIPLDSFGYDFAVAHDTASIGDVYINGEFIKPGEGIRLVDVTAAPVSMPEISAFQAKAALAQAGLLDDIETYMTTEADVLTKLRWQEAPTFRRNNTALMQIAADIGITEEQLDQLFEIGKQITL
jgi:hypothetical protein